MNRPVDPAVHRGLRFSEVGVCVSLHTLPPVSPRWPGSWPDVYVTSERRLGEAAQADHLSLWPQITFNPLTG